MGTQNHGVLFPELLNQFTHFDDLLRVQSHRGFIQYNDIRIPHDRLCKADALPISFGEIADQPPHPTSFVCVSSIISSVCVFLTFYPDLSALPRKSRYSRTVISLYRAAVSPADTPRIFCLLRIGKNIVTVDLHLAARCAKVSCNHIHCRGFSGTIRSEKTIDFPGSTVSVRSSTATCSPYFFDQMIDFNQNHFLLFPVSVSSLRKKCVQKGIIL